MAQRNPSKFVTSGGTVADDPLVQPAGFEMDADDRQFLDNQIRGLQKHIIDHPGGAGSVSQTPLGAAPLAVVKDVSGGAVRHRTVRISGNRSGEQDPAGFDGELHLRPSPIGHYNPHDYGAVGDGVANDLGAFIAMFADMNSVAVVFGNGPAGSVLLADNKTYYFADNLIIERGASFTGPGGGAFINSAPSAQFKFAPGKCIWLKGNGGYDRAAANGANLRRLGLTFQAVPGITSYVHSHAYLAGDLIYLPNDHQFVYECLTGGTTSARPAAVWLAGHAYIAGDLVTPTVPNGHVYTVLVAGDAGTSSGTEPINWNFAPASTTVDGGVTWTEVAASAYFLDWADVALRPGVDIHDASTIWVAGATYEYNQIVRVPGTIASFFWLGPQGGTPQSGTAGATPPTAGTEGTTVSDGLLTWTRYNPVSFCTTDGTAVFMPRFHGGIYITCQSILEDLQIGGTPSNYAVQVQANGGGRPSYNADFWQLSRVCGGSTLNGFIRIRGEDAQGGMAIGCSAFGNFDGVHAHEWDRGFVDLTEAGSAWIGCNSQGHSGYSYETQLTCMSTFTGCYAESSTPNKLLNGVVSGGNLCNSPITTDSFAIMLRGAGVGSRNVRTVDDTNSLTTGSLDCSLAGMQGAQMLGRMTFAIHAAGEGDVQGFTWSNTLFGWPNGWHAWAFAPATYGGAYTSFAVAGDTTPALRDTCFTAKFLIGQPGFFVGGTPGDTPGSATAVLWRAALPTTGKWIVGDIIYNLAPTASGFIGWVCVTAGDFAATPPVFNTFGAISDILETPVATTNATPVYVVLAALAVGDVKKIDVVAKVAKADGTVRQSFKLSGLFYGAAGPTATLDGGSLTDASPLGTGTAVVSLDLSGGNVRLKIVGIAATNLVTTYEVHIL